jgi:hypothetical protein
MERGLGLIIRTEEEAGGFIIDVAQTSCHRVFNQEIPRSKKESDHTSFV